MGESCAGMPDKGNKEALGLRVEVIKSNRLLLEVFAFMANGDAAERPRIPEAARMLFGCFFWTELGALLCIPDSSMTL